MTFDTFPLFWPFSPPWIFTDLWCGQSSQNSLLAFLLEEVYLNEIMPMKCRDAMLCISLRLHVCFSFVFLFQLDLLCLHVFVYLFCWLFLHVSFRLFVCASFCFIIFVLVRFCVFVCLFAWVWFHMLLHVSNRSKHVTRLMWTPLRHRSYSAATGWHGTHDLCVILAQVAAAACHPGGATWGSHRTIDLLSQIRCHAGFDQKGFQQKSVIHFRMAIYHLLIGIYIGFRFRYSLLFPLGRASKFLIQTKRWRNPTFHGSGRNGPTVIGAWCGHSITDAFSNVLPWELGITWRPSFGRGEATETVDGKLTSWGW